MKCALCGRYPDPQTGGKGWYAASDAINYCPECKPRRDVETPTQVVETGRVP